METIPFITKEHGALARGMEQKLLDLPADSGIVFVGTKVTPVEPGKAPRYTILVGIDRNIKVEKAIHHLVSLTLSKELVSGADIKVVVSRGVVRP